MESVASSLTSKQISNISFNFEQDTDLWVVMVSEYIKAQGKNSEKLKAAILDETPEWQHIVKNEKQNNFLDLRNFIINKSTQWNVHIRHLLSDAGHINLLRMYLRALVAQRVKKVADVGGRAKTRQQINLTVAFLGNEAYICLNRLEIASEFVSTGKTEGGNDLGSESILYYTNFKSENQLQIANMLAMVILVKYSTCSEDVDILKDYIRRTAIRPIEYRLDALDRSDKEQARHRLDLYYRLLEAVDIHF